MKVFKDRRPSTTCEFSSTSITATRAESNTYVVSLLEPGTLTPVLNGRNIPGRDAVRTALQRAVAALGVRDPDLAVILPDACCRVAFVDLDVVPERREEAEALIRLRLKKSLPFDVEKARIGWQSQPMDGKISVLAVVIPNAVLEEYESIVREAGCVPGVVLPSILASLQQIDATVPTLLVKVAAASTSIAIVHNRALVHARVLTHKTGQLSDGARLARQIYPSLASFEDVYGMKLQRVLVCGASDELNSVLQELTGVSVQEFPVANDQAPDWGTVPRPETNGGAKSRKSAQEMKVTINFASQPYDETQRFLLRWRVLISGVALLTLVLLCAVTASFFSWRRNTTQLAELEKQIQAQDRQKIQAETFLNRPDNMQIRLRAELLNSLLARKAFSWTEVFTDLEQAVPQGLHVTSIQSVVNEDDKFELHLMVVGSPRGAAIELVRRLEQPLHFAHVQIIDEMTQSPQNAQVPDDRIQYAITAIYIPAFGRGKTPREKAETFPAPPSASELASIQDETPPEAGNAGH